MPRSRSWVPGLVIIIIGVSFLLRPYAGAEYFARRWWAWFILLAAVPVLDNIYRLYSAGAPVSRMAGRIVALLMILLTAAVFILGLDFGRIWPVYLVISGIYVILQSRR